MGWGAAARTTAHAFFAEVAETPSRKFPLPGSGLAVLVQLVPLQFRIRVCGTSPVLILYTTWFPTAHASLLEMASCRSSSTVGSVIAVQPRGPDIRCSGSSRGAAPGSRRDRRGQDRGTQAHPGRPARR